MHRVNRLRAGVTVSGRSAFQKQLVWPTVAEAAKVAVVTIDKVYIHIHWVKCSCIH